MNNRLPSVPTSSSEPAKGSGPESFVGRRVRTRWPEDNAFYEAAITKYDPVEVCGFLNWLTVSKKFPYSTCFKYSYNHLILGSTCFSL